MKVLVKYYGLSEKTEIYTEEKGRRYIDQRHGIFFSITHTANLWFCAVSGYNNGIDAEMLSRHISSPEKLAARFLTEQEQEYVLAGEGKQRIRERLIFLWTRKEAYLKCTGEGLYGLSNAPSVIHPPAGMDLFTSLDEELCFSICTPFGILSGLPEKICLDE